ncbi:hypothetical protein [Paenibacillus polymyxa]|uniref:hypothetical protein n=1 Tax=Paenibacillus polymyxa TaxID=1406 RepID=UPI00298CD79A|nr:hypothetical protein [Paenibacillus polymyxa]
MDKKIQEIKEAHAKMENADLDWGLSILRDYISYLLQQIEIKDKALEFYADEDKYSVDIEVNLEPVLEDCGFMARTALKGEDTP